MTQKKKKSFAKIKTKTEQIVFFEHDFPNEWWSRQRRQSPFLAVSKRPKQGDYLA